MEKRQMIILCTIGKLNINFKSIVEVKVDRNFSDVGDKFSIELVDSPGVTTYDLELYMNAGYRDITISYGDLSTSKLTTYKGTIWDYTNTFVGNIKKLTITGVCDRYAANKQGSSTYLYNIDWNNYFNRREDETIAWGSINASQVRANLGIETITSGHASLSKEFRNARLANAKTLKLTGPSGKSIDLPIPDCFFQLDMTKIPSMIDYGSSEKGFADIPDNDAVDDEKYPEYASIVKDPNNQYWGELICQQTHVATSSLCPYPCPDNAMYRIFQKNDRYNTIAYVIKKNTRDKEGTLYVSLEWHLKHIATKWLNEDENFNLYNYNGYFESGIRGPIKNQEVEWSGDKYINILNSYGELIGFRTDGYSSTHQRDAFLSFEYYDQIDAISTIVKVCHNTAVDSEKTLKLATIFQPTTEDGELDVKEEEPQTEASYDEYDSPYYYWYDKKTGGIRAFLDSENSKAMYIQANPNKASFGGAGILPSNEGVDISWIVKQLCILEGWKTKDEYIVQTQLVPASDTFKMQNQSAFEFIQKNLIPKSVTPAGKYTTKDNETIYVDQPQGGFGIFFDSDGFLHYQPLSQTSLEDYSEFITNLGYNIPGSPTISFQINTKGTAFYNFQPTTITATTITAGVEVTEVEVSEKTAEELKKTVGHNDTFDDWLGLKYDTVQKVAEKNNLTSAFEGDESSIKNAYNKTEAEKSKILYPGTTLFDNHLVGLSQNALVTSPATKLITSSTYNENDILGNIKEAKKSIEDFTITANMNMWGDYRIKPAIIIKITNMVKGGESNSNTPQKHPSSGKYMIKKVSETVSASGYIQSLDLLRFTEDLEKLINPYNIDYTIAAENYNKGEEDGYMVGDVVYNEETGEYEFSGTIIPSSYPGY